MGKTLLWLTVLALAVLYSLLVYGWWQEGNMNRAQQEAELDCSYCLDKR